mgnify:CR=1 FL=1
MQNYYIHAAAKKVQSGGGGAAPTVSGHATIAADLEHYYTMDSDGTDSLASMNLTNNGGTNEAGFLNNGYTIGGYLNAADASTITALSSGLTFGIWVQNTNLAANNGAVVSQGIVSGSYMHGFVLKFGDVSDSKTYVTWLTRSDPGGSFGVSVSSGYIIEASTWYYLIAKWNGSVIELKINNVSMGTTAATNIKSLAGYEFYVGTGTTGHSALTGKIDELMILDRATTDDEDTDLYNAGAGLPYA